MKYEKDTKLLLDDPINDGVLRFESALANALPVARNTSTTTD
jgi:hypothetical protein